VAARVVTTGMFAVGTQLSGPNSRFGVNAGIGDFVLAWDAQWYWYIALHGYPTQLPLTPDGAVAENSWAFMPLYPWIAQIVGFPFGSWGVGAMIVSLVSGYVACLVMYRMMARKIGRTAALWSAVFLAAGPLGALFQIGYAEALFMVFLLLALDGL
ncbi:glycosyltransferase family 39 protein, partial [Cronobacter sakazakii]|uniref:glycosyltransferase family 39 protein n=2 Tax=cellular organisms TaxID=131567 RepID=UPI00117742EF